MNIQKLKNIIEKQKKRERELYIQAETTRNYDTYRRMQNAGDLLNKLIGLEYRTSFVPPRYYTATIETYKPAPEDVTAFEVIKEYVKDIKNNLKEGSGLFISGTNGNGKTHLMYSILKEAAKRKYNAAVYDFATLKNINFEQRDGIIENVKRLDIIGIDDIRTQAANEYAQELFFAIINAAWNNQTAVIITSNLTGKGFADTFGGSVYSRMAGMTKPVVFTGKDERRGV